MRSDLEKMDFFNKPIEKLDIYDDFQLIDPQEKISKVEEFNFIDVEALKEYENNIQNSKKSVKDELDDFAFSMLDLELDPTYVAPKKQTIDKPSAEKNEVKPTVESKEQETKIEPVISEKLVKNNAKEVNSTITNEQPVLNNSTIIDHSSLEIAIPENNVNQINEQPNINVRNDNNVQPNFQNNVEQSNEPVNFYGQTPENNFNNVAQNNEQPNMNIENDNNVQPNFQNNVEQSNEPVNFYGQTPENNFNNVAQNNEQPNMNIENDNNVQPNFQNNVEQSNEPVNFYGQTPENNFNNVAQNNEQPNMNIGNDNNVQPNFQNNVEQSNEPVNFFNFYGQTPENNFNNVAQNNEQPNMNIGNDNNVQPNFQNNVEPNDNQKESGKYIDNYYSTLPEDASNTKGVDTDRFYNNQLEPENRPILRETINTKPKKKSISLSSEAILGLVVIIGLFIFIVYLPQISDLINSIIG
ncbi:MAG: hypothetical protein ACK5HL_01595 [Bacilli bacterium]